MKEIKLTRGLVTMVDDDDYDYLTQWKWQARLSGNTWYAMRSINTKGVITCEIMHRVIMKTPHGLQVDHIDHNGLNNQKANLRNCTHAQNQINRNAYGKSKYLGVYVSVYGTYKAAITRENKRTHLGTFKNEIDAAMAYDKAALLYSNEYVNLNVKIAQ
jgi:hypothetical protein